MQDFLFIGVGVHRCLLIWGFLGCRGTSVWHSCTDPSQAPQPDERVNPKRPKFQIFHRRSNVFSTSSLPFTLLGIGNGANVALTLHTSAPSLSLSSLVLINPFLHVDPRLDMHIRSWISAFGLSATVNLDLFWHLFAPSLLSRRYLERISPPVAMQVRPPRLIYGRVRPLESASQSEFPPLRPWLETDLCIHSWLRQRWLTQNLADPAWRG